MRISQGFAGSLVYFLAHASIFSFFYYSNQYLHNVWGISLGEQGYLAMLACAVSMIGSTIVTTVADITRKHESVLHACSIIYVLSFLLLSISPDNVRHALGEGGVSVYPYAVNMVSVFFASAMFPLVNNSVSRMVRGDGATIAKCMTWGSIGNGVACGTASLAVHTIGEDAVFLLVTVWSMLFWVVLVLCTEGMPYLDDGYATLKREGISAKGGMNHFTKWKRDMGGVMRSRTFLAFMFVTLVAGFARSAIAMYLPFYLKSMDWSEPAVGVIYSYRVLYEALVFPVCGWVGQRMGIGSMFGAGLAAAGLRCMLYALMQVINWDFDGNNGRIFYAMAYALVVEMLKGISTAFTIYAGGRIAHRIAPEGSRSTLQGMFSGLYGSGGTMCAGLLGWLYFKRFPEAAMGYVTESPPSTAPGAANGAALYAELISAFFGHSAWITGTAFPATHACLKKI